MPRPARRSLPLRLIALLAVVLLGLSACTGKKGSGNGPIQPDPVNKTLRIGATLEPATLDPTASDAAAIAQFGLYNVYETLVKVDSDGKLRPLLAKSWTVSDDRLTYTFALRAAKFAGGRDLKARDVVDSIAYVQAHGTPVQKRQLSVIARAAATDDATVTITLTRPSQQWIWDMAGPAGMVFDLTGGGSDLATTSHGSGPYQVKEQRKGASLTLAKNKDYWGTPARFDDVTFRYFTDPTALNNAMLAGDLDIISNVQAPQGIDQFNDASRFKIIDGTTTGEVVLGFNDSVKPLTDPRVRQAITYAIDRKAILQAVWNGKGTLIGSMVPPTDPWYEDLSSAYPFDPAKAKDLLKQAGVENLKLRLRIPTTSYAAGAAPLIASQLKDVGIEVTTEQLDFSTWLSSVFTKGDYDLTIVNHVEPRDMVKYADPSYYWHYDSATFRDLVAKADAGTEADWVSGMRQAAQLLSTDAVSDWLFLMPNLVVTTADISGVSPNAPTASFDLTTVASRK